MLRVTPDTNVIVSGLYGAGNPRWILAAAEAGRIRLKISAAILEEVADVLLVAGDKHLLDLGHYGGFKIVRPSQFAQIGQGRG